jgi:hypothetical protein
MFRAAGLTVGMAGMGGMWCLSAIRRGGTWVRCGGASTFGPAVGRVGKGLTGMGLGGRSS